MTVSDENEQCGVCYARFGDPFATVVFILDHDPKVVPVRMCRECVESVLGKMVEQYNKAAMGNIADVNAVCRLFGLEGFVP